MKVYIGSFIKKDGTLRTMTFCKLSDMPQEVLSEKISGNRSPRKLAEGMELVYDLEADDFRIFNHKQIAGVLKETEISEDTYFN